ncbi:MAG: DUF4476 domain-containing protein [Ginsengibacter sp.]
MITVFSLSVKAQITHFVYLQTENGLPFYVKLNNKIISSSSAGYLILPNIADGTYQIEVGFPKNEFPAENFTFSVDKNNEGFLIKNFEDKGLQLFNMQSLALIPANQAVPDTTKVVATVPAKKEADPFTKMLANVVKDSSILESHDTVVEKSAKPADTTVAVNADSSVVTNNTIPSLPVTADTNAFAHTNSISKLLSTRDKDGLQMIYTDSNTDKTDTVQVFMPAQKEQSVTDNTIVTKKENQPVSSFTDTSQYTITPTVIKPATDTSASGFVARKDSIYVNNDSKTAPVQVFTIGPVKENKEKKTSSDVNSTAKNSGGITDIKITDADNGKQKKSDNKVPGNEITVLPKVVTASKVNSDCKAFASNEDFLKLRKKMAAENNMDNMLKTARKYFRSKCFSTEQIKDLSYLFLTNEGKYKFFDAAYPFTSDSDQYDMLESQLSDEYYLNRFKALISK